MSLRAKTLLLTGLVLVGLIVVLDAGVSRILLTGFARVEESTAKKDAQRALEAYTGTLGDLDDRAVDWAVWDDTYRFVVDKNNAYVQSNLTDGSLARIKLNVIVFVDTSGRIVFAKAIDLNSGRSRPVPDGLAQQLGPGSPLLRPDSELRPTTGLVLLPEGPLRVAARPILTSQAQGPSHGTLIMGKFLDADAVRSLANRTQLGVSAWRVDSGQLPADAQRVWPELRAAPPDPEVKVPTVVQPLDARTIASYLLLADVHGQPAVVFRVEAPRPVYAEGLTSLRYLVGSIVVVGAIFCILALVLLERLVLAPLARLSAGVQAIGASGDVSRRLSVRGRDELARLAGAINDMLAAIESSRARIQRLQQEVVQLRIEIDEAKKTKAVAEITESDYFQELQSKARQFRERPRQS